MNHYKFLYYRKTYYYENKTYYLWYLIDKTLRRGVHFHGRVASFDTILHNQFNFEAFGIECHSPVPLFDFAKEPFSEHCEVTSGPCWGDGTSLYAREKLGHINPNDAEDDKEIWRVLEDYYHYYFEKSKLENENS